MVKQRASAGGGSSSADESLAAVAVRRVTGDRVAAAQHDVRNLLDAGLALMRENPDASPRVADIVRRAGVSNDAFYRAFRSKEDLMAAVADDGARRLVTYVQHQVDKGSDPVDRVRRCVDAVMQQAADPKVAATSRAVLRHATAMGQSRGDGSLDVRAHIADVLASPLADLGSTDVARDALAAACSLFGVMEQFLWSERRPSPDDASHLAAWITRRPTLRVSTPRKLSSSLSERTPNGR